MLNPKSMKPEHEKYILENIGKKTAKRLSMELGIKEKKIKRFLEKRSEVRDEGSEAQPSEQKRREVKPATETVARRRMSRGQKISVILALIAIAVLGTLIYSNSLNGDYIWDDEYLISDNVYVKDPARISSIFTEDFGAGGGKSYGFYRPLQMLTYMAGYSLWGLDVRGYHLVSIFFHIMTSLAVYWLIYTLFGNRLLAFLTGIFFVCHPLHTEAVDYISGLGDPLGGLFLLLSLVFYVRLSRKSSAGNYAGMCVCYFLALFTKEGTVIMPALALLYNYVFREKVKFRYLVSLAGVFGIYIFVRATYVSSVSLDTNTFSTLMLRVPGFFTAVISYLRLLVFPFDQHMEYGKTLFTFFDPQVMAGMVLVFALIAAAFWTRNKNKLVSFSILWFFITIAPVSNFYPIAFYMAEHYMYLPSVGFFMVLSAGLCYFFQRKILKFVAAIICIGLVVFYSVSTYRQNLYWSDNITFYEKSLKYSPDSSRMHNDLGRLYDARGRSEEAIIQYKEALRIDPENPFPYNNIGVIMNNDGKYGESVPYFEKALKLLPTYSDAWNNIGVAYSSTGKDEAAIDAYKNAIETKANFAGAYSNLGNMYGKMERYDEAISTFNKAIEVNPHFINAYYNLSLIYEKMGDVDKTIEILKRAINVDPGFGAAQYRLAVLYYNKGQYDLSRKYLNDAIKSGHPVHEQFITALDNADRQSDNKGL